jgi:hypothetical protein
MIYLLDFEPKNCPNCNREYKWDSNSRAEFHNGCSQICPCGVKFQFLTPQAILSAALLHPFGDLHYHETGLQVKPGTVFDLVARNP